MKILLTAINAKYIHSNPAVYSLRAYARDFQAHTAVVEYTINHRTEFLLQELYKQQPDVLVFSCYLWNLPQVRILIKELKKLRPRLPIWLGGPEVSYQCEGFLQEHPMVKGIMRGEGEETFRQLCEHYVNHLPLKQVRGIVYREENGEIHTAPGQPPVSMDALPFWYEELSAGSDASGSKESAPSPVTSGLKRGASSPVMSGPKEGAPSPVASEPSWDSFAHRILYYETSRGCPFRCSYCLSSIEKSLRFKSLSRVFRELSFFLERNVPQVKLVDRTFNCNPKHALAIWRYIKEHDNGVTNFHFEVSGDLLEEEAILLLQSMRPGLVQLEIGVQSVNPRTLREIRRSMDLPRLKENVRRLREGKSLHQHLDLIAGLPYEGFDSFCESFNEVYRMRPQQLQLGFLKVLKGSWLYENRDAYGMIYRDDPPYEVMATRWLSYEELLQLKKVEEMVEVYYNSGQFELTMQVLELAFSDPFQMFFQLGEFYEKKGLFFLHHSRLRRCEILLDFTEESGLGRRKLYEELLTFDLYYRENMKSRPAWAPDLSLFKEQARGILKKGRQMHAEPFFHDFTGLLEGRQTGYPRRNSEYRFYLFSYEERNPLTGQARVTCNERE